MRLGDSTHRVRRWLIIEKNTTAAVDLQVDEPRREYRSRRHNFGWPATRTLTTGHDRLNDATSDQNERMIVPSVPIENTVRRNCKLGWCGLL
jgi:hypothetical protein